MLSKAQISLITSLQHKKFRTTHGLFIVEGIKSVTEFVHSSYKVQKIFATDQACAKLLKIPQSIKPIALSENDFNKISALKSPQGALALVEIPERQDLDLESLKNRHTLVLDGVQDPGNLGTIIRTAEWFGIEQIVCSQDTVDAYNPKVVQATMGSLARVKLHYTAIDELIQQQEIPTYGALLEGKSIYDVDFGSQGLIIMGNEGNGIRPELIPSIKTAVTIPRIGLAESLNVAVATTIFCSEIARRKLTKAE
ncbi:TrmH family RNA methyltransferase [Sphingobacterium yanglingense]|uniref:TrmH family RNA methyltransferase n=1 Tax=Sphingobacterium yanglingense TaxID=1437280 RepID=A0A4R6WS45_9SPHI|nr:RNA methyltransferase [Sphingobacterium yanglingense]TDQ81746.1 TrmH family RNA methyltransferase [Sphingobacterium yanglingense]